MKPIWHYGIIKNANQRWRVIERNLYASKRGVPEFIYASDPVSKADALAMIVRLQKPTRIINPLED